MLRLVVHGRTRLEGDVDIAAVLAAVPLTHTIKGMFVSRVARELGRAAFDGKLALLSPPRLGRYLPFTDYPLADYFLLFDALARASFLGIASREATRLLARTEIETFVATTLGRVSLSLLDSPAAALLKYPDTFGVLARGPRASAMRIDGGVRVTFDACVGPPEYAIGVLEGIVLTFAASPRIHATIASSSRATYDVSWT